MSARYAQIAFSPGAVRRQQQSGSFVDYGAQLDNAGMGDDSPARLDLRERGFISRVDSFFLATVTASGWPYVQHRGGPKGFLHVLDSTTIGFADFAGNQQYVTAGNLEANSRVSLFLIDYPHRERLKLYGTAAMYDPADAPDLTTQLLTVGARTIRSRVDRLIVISIEAYNWNCTSHIKPLYDKARLDEALALERDARQSEIDDLHHTIEELRAANRALARLPR